MDKKAKANVQRTVVILLCVMVVFVGAAISRILRDSGSDHEQMAKLDSAALQQQGAFIRPQPKELDKFQLTSASGAAFTPADLRGQWNLIFLGYTHCPDICPETLGLFKQLSVHWQAGEMANTRYVLLSADPERDTPEHLREYLDFFNQDFVGVTGDVGAVAGFAKQLNGLFARVPQLEGGYLVDHSANIMIINPAGQYHGFIRPPHSLEQFLAVMEVVSAAYQF